MAVAVWQACQALPSAEPARNVLGNILRRHHDDRRRRRYSRRRQKSMKMHDVLARRAHVLTKLVMQDRLDPAFAQKPDVVPVEIVSDKANGGLLPRFDRFENGDISAAHRVDCIDFPVCRDNLENPLFSERVKAMVTAGVDQRELRLTGPQRAPEAYFTFFFAAEALVAHRYQNLSRLRSEPLGDEIGRSRASDAIVEPGVGNAP